jgi:hypothetical protein
MLALLPVAAIAPDLPASVMNGPVNGGAIIGRPVNDGAMRDRPIDERTDGQVGLMPDSPRPLAARWMDSFAASARALRQQEDVAQVRIEQRIIIRIAPGVPSHDLRDERRGLFGPAGRPLAPRLEERKMTQCLAVAGIAGVQPDGPSRLMLFMRDQRIISAALEKTCNARDFYSGFLVERSTDGMICAGRDKLLSRSGSNCALGKLRQLVSTDDDE